VELGNPTFVVEVDRNDLDDQLHDEFVAARSLVGPVEQAESVEDLRRLLQRRKAERWCSPRLRSSASEKKNWRIRCSPLRDNIIIIADESTPARSTASCRAMRATLPKRCRTPGGWALPGDADQLLRGRHGRGFRQRHPHIYNRPGAGRSRDGADLLRTPVRSSCTPEGPGGGRGSGGDCRSARAKRGRAAESCGGPRSPPQRAQKSA
jgi:hypothetical protein